MYRCIILIMADASLIVSIISMLISCIGIILHFIDNWRSQCMTVHNYLDKIDELEFILARQYVYSIHKTTISDPKVSMVVSVFHHWGLLVKKNFLPIWIFDSASGYGVCRLYNRTKYFIFTIREEHGDSTYAEGFEWLVNTVIKRLKKANGKGKDFNAYGNTVPIIIEKTSEML